MNILSQIDFEDATRYFSKERVVVGGKQYKPHILNISFNHPGSRDGSHESASGSITLADRKNKIRNLMSSSSSKYVKGIEIRLYWPDGTKIAQLIILDVDYDIQSVTFSFTDTFVYLDRRKYINSSYKISSDNLGLSSIPAESLKHVYNFFSGPFASWANNGKNTLRAYRITSNKYILGKPGTNTTLTTGTPGSLQYVRDPDGNAVTLGNNTLSLTSGVYIIQNSTDGPYDYIDVNFTLTTPIGTYEVLEDIKTEFFTSRIEMYITEIIVAFGTSTILGGTINQDPTPAKDNTYLDKHYAITELYNGADIVSDIQEGFFLNYYIDSEARIHLDLNKIINNTNIDALINEIIQENKAKKFKPTAARDNESDQLNRCPISNAYQFTDGTFENKLNYKKNESITNIGYTIAKPREFKFHPAFDDSALPLGNAYAHTVAKVEMIERKYPIEERSFQIPIKYIYKYQPVPFDVWKFSHEIFNDTGDHYMRIRRINYSNFENTVVIDFEDYTHAATIARANYFKLISDADVDEDYNIYDESINGHHIVYAKSSTIRHRTGDNDGYYNSCLYFESANSDYLEFGSSQRYRYFDMWYTILGAPVSPKFSIWMRIKFVNLDSTEIICGCYEDSDNRYQIFKRPVASGNVLRFVLREGAVNKITMNGATAIADTNWHTIVFAKNSTTYAFYLDGSQDSYVSDADTGDIAGGFLIGADYDGVAYSIHADIKISVIAVYHDLYGPLDTELAPNVGITDTHSIPAGRWSDNKGEIY